MNAHAMTQVTVPFVTHDWVRWADVDLAGVMRYDAYTRLVDVGETDFFRAIGMPISVAAERLGIWLPRKVMRFEYHAPARLDERLRVGVRVVRLGDSSCTIDFAIAVVSPDARRAPDAERAVATARLVMVCTGHDLAGKRSLPDALRQALAPYVVPTPGDAGRA